MSKDTKTILKIRLSRKKISRQPDIFLRPLKRMRITHNQTVSGVICPIHKMNHFSNDKIHCYFPIKTYVGSSEVFFVDDPPAHMGWEENCFFLAKGFIECLQQITHRRLSNGMPDDTLLAYLSLFFPERDKREWAGYGRNLHLNYVFFKDNTFFH